MQTDESLRVERARSDEIHSEKLAAIDATADAVISKARVRADQILASARAKTDRKRTSTAGSERLPQRLQDERVLEDQTLREERASADDQLRAEREEHQEGLTTERGETDKGLSSERALSDRAVASRDALFGIVGHDLRSMLHAVVGQAELIALDEALEDHAASVLRRVSSIARGGMRMDRLIGDLLDVASIQAGMLSLTLEEGDPGLVVAEALESFVTHGEACGVSVELAAAPSSLRAIFDPARILQVLINLLSNALKFTPAPGKIVIRVEAAGDQVLFSISNTGLGIAPDKLESIFERFYQVARNDRRGVGLGLYISKCIVAGHGGRIWAQSVLGQSSTFFFTLPIRLSDEQGRAMADLVGMD